MSTGRVKLALGAVAALLGVSVWARARQRKKDRLAAKVLRAVTNSLKPDEDTLQAEQAFDIHYAGRVFSERRAVALSGSAAESLAGRIASSWGFFYDDEAKVFAVLREAKDKAQVSQIAKAYQALEEKNLIDVLYERLSREELKKALSIVKNKPPYTRA